MVRGQVTDKWVVMEPPSYSPVPGGLLVACYLLNLLKHPSHKVPVILKNETERDITIPGKSVIADVHAVQRVISNRDDQKGDAFSKVEGNSVLISATPHYPKTGNTELFRNYGTCLKFLPHMTLMLDELIK